MAWDSAADLLRDLVAWEAGTTEPGGHWPWDERQGFRPVECTVRGTPVARIGGERVSVRRALWVAVWGALPADVRVGGVCAEPGCVRPAHGHVDLVAGRADPHRHHDVPASIIRWDRAWPGQAGERRGRRLDVRRRAIERRRPGSELVAAIAAARVDPVTDLVGLGEHPAGHLRAPVAG